VVIASIVGQAETNCMISAFFTVAARAPGRQSALRQAVVTHLMVLTGMAWLLHGRLCAPSLLGHVLLVAGIAEGAVLLGWRLTQLPKSQALEFLLVSSLQPWRVGLAEILVGMTRLALVTLAGVPVLIVLVADGALEFPDIAPLLIMPLTWGAITGVGLAAWAFEPLTVRRWAERIAMALVLFYLVIGLVAGEHLKDWLAEMPADVARWFLNGFVAFHRYNPFAVMEFWFKEELVVTAERALGLEVGALILGVLLVARSASRLKAHFHELHYFPMTDLSQKRRVPVGERPLSWWAVKRVRQFSGRINLWLAGVFGVGYALHTVAAPVWPSWLGQRAFEFFNYVGGIPLLATGLVILAAVPAAFQYGLWDSNAQDRCRRLELLLLTDLEARDYWRAAAAAAWQRGRGYFAVAVLLWAAAALAGQVGLAAAIAALAAAVVLWGLYFSLGFRAFARGLQATRLGLLLTVGLPLLAFSLHRAGWHVLARWLPPGSVHGAAAGSLPVEWLAGPLLGGCTALLLARSVLVHCDDQLRQWYDQNHGRKVVE
jgi:hypothetical protein